MGREKTYRLSGFVSLNTGDIQDCYSQVRVGRSGECAGFCGENRGKITTSYAHGKVGGSRQKAGFCQKQNGSVAGNFWLSRRDKEDEKERFTDWELARKVDELPEALPQAGWDMEDVWSLTEGDPPRLYDVRENLPLGMERVTIADRDDLLNAAEEIRQTGGIGKCYILTSDIDLRHKTWEPLGDQDTPFRGVFDGAGYEVRNFRIKANHHHYAGFFGVVAREGAVHNLTVDCVILGRGGYSAPLCALNQGKIYNCVSRGHTHASRRSGGLAAQNEGTIRRSCSIGGVRAPFLFLSWLPLAALLSLLFFAGTMAILLTGQPAEAAEAEVFAPVITDPNAVPMEMQEEETTEPEEITDTSVCFIMNAEMLVGTENYTGVLNLRCPNWSTKGFVGTLTLNGTTIYKSGLIAPGYGVDTVTLSGDLAPGEYECIMTLNFYDTTTYEKAALNTTVPLVLTVQ